VFLALIARLKNAKDIDRAISAQIPDPEKYPKLYELVTKLMVHNPCGAANPNAPCIKDGKCSKGYPKPFQAQTQLSEDGYTLYARPDNGRHFINAKGQTITNQWIVPHCPKYVIFFPFDLEIRALIFFAQCTAAVPLPYECGMLHFYQGYRVHPQIYFQGP
jgi:hypothetical protein